MEKGSARELRKSSDLYLRKHLVRHRRICNEGTAFIPDPLLSAGCIDHFSDLISEQGTQVAGMHAFLSGSEGNAHILIDLIHSSLYRGYKASAGHCDID